MVTRTRHNVPSFVHCLSCSNIKQFIVLPKRQNRKRSFTASRIPIFSSSVTSITWQYARLYLPYSRGHGQCYVNRGLEEDLMMLSIWMNSLKTSCSRRTYSSDEGPDTTAHLSLNNRLMFSWHERYNIQHASAEVYLYLVARHCA